MKRINNSSAYQQHEWGILLIFITNASCKMQSMLGFKISLLPMQVNGHFKHMGRVLFVTKFSNAPVCFNNIMLSWSDLSNEINEQLKKSAMLSFIQLYTTKSLVRARNVPECTQIFMLFTPLVLLHTWLLWLRGSSPLLTLQYPPVTLYLYENSVNVLFWGGFHDFNLLYFLQHMYTLSGFSILFSPRTTMVQGIFSL